MSCAPRVLNSKSNRDTEFWGNPDTLWAALVAVRAVVQTDGPDPLSGRARRLATLWGRERPVPLLERAGPVRGRSS